MSAAALGQTALPPLAVVLAAAAAAFLLLLLSAQYLLRPPASHGMSADSRRLHQLPGAAAAAAAGVGVAFAPVPSPPWPLMAPATPAAFNPAGGLSAVQSGMAAPAPLVGPSGPVHIGGGSANGTASTASTASGGLSGVAVALLSVSLAALVAALFVVATRCRKKMPWSMVQLSLLLPCTSSSSNKGTPGAGPTPSIPHALKLLRTSDFSIDTDSNGNPWVLGQGNFGTVYRGRLGSDPVAIKVLKGSHLGDLHRELFLREVAILLGCRSPHLVNFLGSYMAHDEVAVVVELCAGGTLWSAVQSKEVSWKRRGYRIALEVAMGLQYLHSNNIVHLDIKSANILLTGEGRAKIADVGLSQVLPPAESALPQPEPYKGTLAWSSPEQLLGAPCSYSSDIYSLGVLLWQLCTGEPPRRGHLREVAVPDEAPAGVRQLIDDCLQDDPSQRPTAQQVVSRLQELISSAEPSDDSSSTSSPEVSQAERAASLAASLSRAASLNSERPRRAESPANPFTLQSAERSSLF